MHHKNASDVRAFAARCHSAFTKLACIAAGVTGSRDGAEDIVQQAIAIAIGKDNQFESDDDFVAWLGAIVKNCALNQRRKSARRKTYATDPVNLEHVEYAADSRPVIDDKTGSLDPMQTSFDDRLQNALLTLSPDARSCLLLRTVEQLSYREISLLMQIPEGTAMSLVHRSKSKLREILGRANPDHSETGENP